MNKRSTLMLLGGLMSAVIAGAAAAQQMPADLVPRVAALGHVIDSAGSAKIYGPLQPAMPVAGVKAERDIAYGPGPKETLDVFSSETKGAPKPILIFVHGGGFVGGDKNKSADGAASPFYDNIMLWAVAHGMVGVNINYTLAPKATYPTVQHEMAEAVAWARANAAKYGGDPKRVVLWGHSAGGGHVGSYVAHPEVYADVAGAKAPVSAAVMTSGFYTFAGPKNHVYYGPAATLAERSSTAGLIASKVPIFVIHAELDPAAIATESETLHIALTAAGRPHSFLVAMGHGHMSESYSVGSVDESVSGPVLNFIRSQTK